MEATIDRTRLIDTFKLTLVPVLGAAVLGFDFGVRLLLTNDDTRFPVLARDALKHGHWLVQSFPDGTLYLNKPPLAVWLIALSSWPAGAVDVRSAVLPSVLEAFAVVLLTFWIGRRLFELDAGVVAGLSVVTMVGVHSMAQSSMPDMAQLAAGTAAMAVYIGSRFGDERAWLVPLYAVIGLGSLAKGAAGFIPLAIIVVDTVIGHGMTGLRRLISIPGLMALAALAVPWWVVSAVSGGGTRFVHGVIVNDQLLSYFWRPAWTWPTLAEPLVHAVTVLMPWGLLVPLAARRALRQADPDTRRRLRLLLVWFVTALVLVALSARQRERYYLPLCPATALFIGWWYTTWPARWRARAFAGAWIAIAVAGAWLSRAETVRFNATTDLHELRALLARAPAPVRSVDLQDLALSFNLDHPVATEKGYARFEARASRGETGYLVISDRALAAQPPAPCMRRVATGLVTRHRFTVLASRGCDNGTPPARSQTSVTQ